MIKNIAITGSSGYIGSYLSRFLHEKKYQIYEMSRKVQNSSVTQIPFTLGTINNYTPLKEIDVLIHCAYDFSHHDYLNSQKINLDGTIELFKAAREHGVKKIIYISSLSAFEKAKSNYGRIKYATEQHAKNYNAVIVRPGLVYDEHAKGIVGSINKVIKKSKIVPVLSLKEKMFYPCHLNDLSLFIEQLVKNDVETTSPFTAAAEQALSFAELIRNLASLQNRKVLLLPIPYSLVFGGLKAAELAKINIGFRSDSLKNIRFHPAHIAFDEGKKLGVTFRLL